MEPNLQIANSKNRPRNSGSTNASARLNILKQMARETPFRLTYGVEAIIPVEIGEPSPRLLLGPEDTTAERNLIDDVRTEAHLAELALKQR
ncbi:hypothetical protein PIB30_082047 [Stylosanthes scabra]|uniref:Uncharacterized protein n=1 Tax=Stylosanthes scabra TaxID=79078 RepID=A0ABU6ST72_9FABA|nr:hypothetical protein [Stylosanthes scabra]